jgi:hypothetical protein
MAAPHDPADVPSDDEPGHRVIAPRDVVAFDAAAEDIFHVGTTGNKVTIISGLDDCAALRTLTLRSNLLRRMTGVGHLVNLTQLELYDNKIERLEDLVRLTQIEVLDMSYNRIRAIEHLSTLGSLQRLYLAWCDAMGHRVTRYPLPTILPGAVTSSLPLPASIRAPIFACSTLARTALSESKASSAVPS